MARLAHVAAGGVRVDAEAAVNARDTSDEAALELALARARRAFTRVVAGAEEAPPNPLARAQLAGAQAELARAEQAAAEAARWDDAARRWEAVGRPYLQAQARWRQAEAHLARREREPAAAAAREAQELAMRVGSEWLIVELASFAARARLDLGTPERAATPDPTEERPFGLTERELQVLELVATGATNREIGERLFMAEKTASVHVSRILAKLDVRGRTEAAALAARQGIVAHD